MGCKRFVSCGLALAQRGHACTTFAAYIVIMAALSACGGSGGGSGPAASSGQVVQVTQPPIYRSSLRTPLSFGSRYNTEYQRQIGLTQIGAAVAYDAGYAGFNVKVGIVDTGIDGTHSEIDHIAGGKDFQGNSLGLEDPDGHGTHVASLLVAKRNSLKMHGVAPHANAFSYRIFDGHGTFGSKTGGQIMPSLVSDARHKQIDILNHSWASHYEITDLSKSVISSSLGAELPAWQAAVDDGMALIWAAGNEGDDDVSIRAGLPYHFSGLRKGWLAVVSLDPDGKELRHTNRCGVAKKWCLAAPGGGDIPFHSGLYGAKSAAGYLPYTLGKASMLAALRVLAAGEIYVPVEMMARDDTGPQQSSNYLTGRERDVLNGLLAGQSNKEIARVHGLSEVTIKHHLKSLRSKLGARNRTHAVCRAIELGIAEDKMAMA